MRHIGSTPHLGRWRAAAATCVLLASLLLLLSELTPVMADAEPVVVPSPQHIDIIQGEVDVIDLLISNVTGVYGIDIQVRFDPAVIEIVDADAEADGVQVYPGDLPQPDNVTTNWADNQTGVIRYTATQQDSAPAADSGVVLTILVSGRIAGRQSPLTIEAVTATNQQGAILPMHVENGTINVVSATPQPTPQSQQPSATPPPPTATRTITGQALPSPTVTPTPTSPMPQSPLATPPPPTPTLRPPSATPQPTVLIVQVTPTTTPRPATPPVADKIVSPTPTSLPMLATPEAATVRAQVTITPLVAALPPSRSNVAAPTVPTGALSAARERGGPVPLGAAPPVESSDDTLRQVVGLVMILAGSAIGLGYLIYRLHPEWFRRRPTR